MKILSYLKKRKDFVKRKQIILFGTMAAVIVGGVSVVHAADTSISSHGEIWFDNETTDTSDDVFFNAADLEMLNKKIDGNQNTINDTINTLQNDLNKEIDEINSNLSDGNIKFFIESDGAYVTYKIGADTVTKKLGSVSPDSVVSIANQYYTANGTSISKSYTVSETGIYLVSADNTYGTEYTMNRLSTGNVSISVSNAMQKNISTGSHAAVIITKTTKEQTMITVTGSSHQDEKTTYLGISIWKLS